MNSEKPKERATKAVERLIVASLGALLALVLVLPPLEAQELKRDLPLLPCTAERAQGEDPAAPSESDRLEAERLSSEANQAAILGDLEAAIERLQEAAELDPLSSSVAYRLARSLEDAGRTEAALGEFCRYLALEPDAADAAETLQRAERLAYPERAPLSATARSAFEEGISAFDRGSFDQAAQYFSRAIVERPEWDDAYYNRGVSYLRAGRSSAAAADLELYLERNPEASDREVVQEQLLQISPAPEYSPGIALATGLLVPGMGQFYSGKPRQGFLFLAAGGTAAAVGLLYRKVEVVCLQVPVDGVCPPDQILEEREERPLLVPGLVAAVSISVVGAILAYRGARDANTRLVSEGGGIQLPLPEVWSGALSPSLKLEPEAWRGPRGASLVLEVRF